LFDLSEFSNDTLVSLVPADSFELMGSLWTGSPQGIAEPMFGVYDFGSVPTSAAEHSQGMPLLGFYADQPSFLDTDLHPTSGRTDAADAFLERGRGELIHWFCHRAAGWMASS
jgi:hypothetical protein